MGTSNSSNSSSTNEPTVLGGLPCAKAVIDNGNAVTQAMHCMNASIFLNAHAVQPTDDHVKLFREAGDALVKVCAEIEVYVSQGGTT